MIRSLLVCLALLSLCLTAVSMAEDSPQSDGQIEQMAQKRLSVLREQLAEIQREIRGLEELTQQSTQIQVSIRMIEVETVEAQKLGLVPLASETPVTPIPTHTNPISSTQTFTSAQIVNQFLAPERADELVDKLREQGQARILAEPMMITESGRPASLMAGGEFPIQIPQKDETVHIDWKELGVKAEATPRLLDNGRVGLSFSSRVSERDLSRSVKVNGMIVPGVRTHQMTASVEMDFGKTLVMSGLKSPERQETTPPASPIVNKVPYVSRLFTQVSHAEEPQEKSLIVLVTPSLVRPSTK